MDMAKVKSRKKRASKRGHYRRGKWGGAPYRTPPFNTTPTYNMIAIHTKPLARIERFDGEYLVGMASLGFAASSSIAQTSGAGTFAKASQR